jgi:cell division septal protein FtsQ
MSQKIRAGNKNNKKSKIGLKFIGLLFILGLLISIINFSASKLINSNFFQINRVKIKGDVGWLEQSVRFLIAKNLFYIDLKKAEAILWREHPELETITLSKLWPDTIYITFSLKKPIAALESSPNFLIDKNGFLLAKQKYEPKLQNLPILSGINPNQFDRNAQNFRLNPDKKLVSAIELITLFSRSRALSAYQLEKVDVAKLSESTFFIRKNDPQAAVQLKVNIGEGNFKEKIKIFEIFLKKANLDWNTVNYIDLRFKEPLVGLKNG